MKYIKAFRFLTILIVSSLLISLNLVAQTNVSTELEVKIDNITIKSHLNEIAHTKTDAMFVIVEDKVLITGDNKRSAEHIAIRLGIDYFG